MTVSSVLILLVLLSFSAFESGSSTNALCCEQTNTYDLMNCIHIEADEHNAKQASSITLLSYASSNILDFASYSFAVNAAYAVANRYGFKILDESTSNYEPVDQRWNRVQILLREVEKNLHKNQYIVWFDADLIFLNQTFSIQHVINENYEFDIILSAERHAATGVANTGCMIIKSTLWSLYFLRLWWESFDRRLNHDQIFFDKLYKSLLPSVSDHVKILESHVLNSHPPAVLFQEIQHGVLHLMGERSDVRSEIFRFAFKSVCSPHVPHQLGLSREVLLEMTLHTYRARFLLLFEKLKSVTSLIESVSEIREILLQAVKYTHSQSEVLLVVDNLFDQVLFNQDHRIKFRRYLYEKINHEVRLEGGSVHNRELLLNLQALLGNDLAQDYPIIERAKILDEVLIALRELRTTVSINKIVFVDEMLSSVYHSMGIVSMSVNGDGQEATFFLRLAIETIKSYGSLGNPYHLVEPMSDLASLYCSIGLSSDGLQMYDDLIALLRSLLGLEQQLKEHHLTLAKAILLRSKCCALVVDAGLLRDRSSSYKGDIEYAVNILYMHPERKSSVEIMHNFEEVVQAALKRKNSYSYMHFSEENSSTVSRTKKVFKRDKRIYR